MNTTIEIGESVEEDDEGNEVVVEAVPAKVNIPIEKKIEVDETWMVNSANVRRFLRRMGGNRRETWESTLQTSVKWLEKGAVARRSCTFVEERLSQHPCQAFVKEGAGTLADLSHTKAGPRIEATSE